MSNPLSHIGQTPHPEVSTQVQQQCAQAQPQQQGGQDQGGGEGRQPGDTHAEPPATRLPQHPQQQQDDPLQRPGEQQRIRQQGETRAEDTTLPAPTDAD